MSEDLIRFFKEQSTLLDLHFIDLQGYVKKIVVRIYLRQ